MKAATHRQAELSQVGAWKHGLIFLVAGILVVTRRPDALFHAQFWAEDGAVFFQNAYNSRWWSPLTSPYGGYFHAVPRIGALLAVFVPLSAAPLVLNIIAIAFQVLPANLLLSARSAVWGGRYYRALLASIYLALPNCWEINANVTGSQNLLALSAFLLLVASPPETKAARLFDISILLLFGLSGPFVVLLMPIALFLAWLRHDRWQTTLATVLAVTCIVEVAALIILRTSTRPYHVLGASPALFARILSSQVYLGVLLGSNGLGMHPGSRLFVFLVCVAIGGTAIVFFCFLGRSSIEMKLFLLFSALVLAASLVSPLLKWQVGVPVWELLTLANGSHYWFFPMLAFGWSILWCLQSKPVLIKIIAAYLLFFMAIAVVRNWEEPAFKDMHFAKYVGQLEGAQVGTEVEIPINPEGWSMRLIKR